jgi:hypothetical protein
VVTPDGLEWLWSGLTTRLATATIRVSDGDQVAEAALSRSPEYVGVLTGQPVEPEAPEETVTLVRISLTAVFGPNEANFEWKQREIVVDGKVIDLTEEDLGRKAQGTASTLETHFDAVVG